MLDETEENWKSCVAKTIDLSPDSVTVYEMEIPYNTTIYQRMKSEGKLVAPVADWPTKRRWVDYAFSEFEAAGYAVGSAYTMVKDPGQVKFVYRDELWEGADLLPLGVASFGQLSGIHVQNQADVGPYMMQIDAGKSAFFRAYATDEEERFIREFILRLKLGKVQVSYYQEKFGIDVRERFAAQLAYLAEEGFLAVEGDDIVLSRPGLLQIDRLLHEFFLKKHRHARYT